MKRYRTKLEARFARRGEADIIMPVGSVVELGGETDIILSLGVFEEIKEPKSQEEPEYPVKFQPLVGTRSCEPRCNGEPCVCQPQEKEECLSCGSETSTHAPDCRREEECKHEKGTGVESEHFRTCLGCGVALEKPQPKQKPSEWIEARQKELEKEKLARKSQKNIIDLTEPTFETAVKETLDKLFANSQDKE